MTFLARHKIGWNYDEEVRISRIIRRPASKSCKRGVLLEPLIQSEIIRASKGLDIRELFIKYSRIDRALIIDFASYWIIISRKCFGIFSTPSPSTFVAPLILKQVYLRPTIDNFELPVLLLQYNTIRTRLFVHRPLGPQELDANDPPS